MRTPNGRTAGQETAHALAERHVELANVRKARAAVCRSNALHEIESLFAFVVAAVVLVGYSVPSVRIPKPTPPVDNAEHLAPIVELLDCLKKAKAQELREAAKRAAAGKSRI